MGSSTHPAALIANDVDSAYPLEGVINRYPPVGGELHKRVIIVEETIVLLTTGLADRVNEYLRPATKVLAGNEIGKTTVVVT